MEGYHRHQKSWLGPSRHTCTNGLALIADGSLRWNRKRKAEEKNLQLDTQLVFEKNLLRICDSAHHEHMSNATAISKSPVRTLVAPSGGREGSALTGASLSGCVGMSAAPCQATDGASRNRQHVAMPVPQAGVSAPLATKRNERTMRARVVQKTKIGRPVARQAGSRSGCRICRMTGADCRLHKRIQWSGPIGNTFMRYRSAKCGLCWLPRGSLGHLGIKFIGTGKMCV